jgi:hypothetical protein
MKRREFIKLIGGVAASWPLAAQAQQQSMPVIGFVTTTMKHAARFLENVRKGLAEYGYIDGQNYRFEIPETNFQSGRAPIFYQQFVDQKVTLIITTTTLSGCALSRNEQCKTQPKKKSPTALTNSGNRRVGPRAGIRSSIIRPSKSCVTRTNPRRYELPSRTLKAMAKDKKGVSKIAKALKRSPGAISVMAAKRGVSLSMRG